MCRINNMGTSGLRRLHLCFFYLVSHKILIRFKAGLGFSINKNSVSYLLSVYCAAGMVLGDIHVLMLAHIYEMWIFYFPINHNNTSLSPYSEIHLMGSRSAPTPAALPTTAVCLPNLLKVENLI